MLLFSYSGFCQIDKGTIAFGGEIFVDFSKEKYSIDDIYKEFSIAFGPEVGYFIFDNISIGCIPLISYSSIKGIYDDRDDLNTTTKSFGINLNSRKYFGKRMIKPLIGLGLGIDKTSRKHYVYGYFNNEYSYQEENENYLYFIADLIAGISIKINDKINVDLIANYNNKWINKTTDEGGYYLEDNSIFRFGTGITLFY